ncbi:MAG: (d)CMP kinase [Rhodobacteraceae bacterium]|nr:(d)CMP kinase [Paracoccaceae bacterium]
MQFTVAIDGPAAAGKGTVARAVADKFGFSHLDTGLLYRAVGAKAMMRGRGVIAPDIAAEIAKTLSEDDLTREGLRTARVAQAASKVAALPEVRAALLDFQMAFAKRQGGAVLDGRDIGTVICPEADVKLYVTASDTVRAERRYLELKAKKPETKLETVAIDLCQRDIRDASRDVAPMRAAADATVIDTSDMDIEVAVQAAIDNVQAAIDARG